MASQLDIFAKHVEMLWNELRRLAVSDETIADALAQEEAMGMSSEQMALILATLLEKRSKILFIESQCQL